MKPAVIGLSILALLASAAAQELWHDPSPHRTQFVQVDDAVQLEVLDWGGTGPALVFLAGYMTAHAYDDLAPKLTNIGHVYGITRRGLGASSRPSTGYSARQSAKDVLLVLDHLGLEKPVLIGHSFGGQDLSFLGANYPDRMAALVYLNSAEDTSIGPVVLEPELRLLIREVPPRPDKSSFNAYRLWQQKTYGMAFPESELRQLYAADPDGSVGKYLVSDEVRQAMFEGLERPEYSRIRVPVLAFFAVPAALDEQMKKYHPQTAEQGMQLGLKYGLSLAWVADNVAALKRGVPDARVLNLGGANNYIFFSNEADVVRELDSFVKTLPR